MHCKTITFNIKIPLNIHNFCDFARGACQIFLAIFSRLLPPPPPPPNPKKWIDAAACQCIWYLSLMHLVPITSALGAFHTAFGVMKLWNLLGLQNFQSSILISEAICRRNFMEIWSTCKWVLLPLIINLLSEIRVKSKTFGDRAFEKMAPNYGITSPKTLDPSQTLMNLNKSMLKTHLFDNY